MKKRAFLPSIFFSLSLLALLLGIFYQFLFSAEEQDRLAYQELSQPELSEGALPSFSQNVQIANLQLTHYPSHDGEDNEALKIAAESANIQLEKKTKEQRNKSLELIGNVLIEHPKGRLKANQVTLLGSSTGDFSKKLLLSDSSELILLGEISLSFSSYGTLQSEGPLHCFLTKKGENVELDSLNCQGRVEIHYQSKEKANSSLIIGHGDLSINNKLGIMTLTSPRESDGKILPENQILLKDALGQVKANQLTLFYALSDSNSIQPQKVVLEGNIQLLDWENGSEQSTQNALHYVLTDHLEYFPQQEELIVSAREGGRVLLFDKTHNIQMSAPALTITRKGDAKEKIVGHGDVRFSFLEQELEALHQQFQFAK